MICPECGARMKVLKSQEKNGGRYRRYSCMGNPRHPRLNTMEFPLGAYENKIDSLQKRADSMQFRLDFIVAKLRELTTIFAYGDKRA